MAPTAMYRSIHPIPIKICHNVGIHSLKLPCVIACAMATFQSNKMVAHIAHLSAILAVDITRSGSVGWWHGLHPHSRIKQRKVFSHIIGGLFT